MCGRLKAPKSRWLWPTANPVLTGHSVGDSESKVAVTPDPDSEQKNLAVYIDLLRKDVRQQRAEIMGSVMVLSADDAAKFWPIRAEYDAALTKLNDQRAENIKEYAHTYTQMTDEKADELIQKAWAYQGSERSCSRRRTTRSNNLWEP